MARSKARHNFGTGLWVSATGANLTQVGADQLTSIDHNSTSFTEISTFHYNSPQYAKEKEPGAEDSGVVNYSFDGDDALVAVLTALLPPTDRHKLQADRADVNAAKPPIHYQWMIADAEENPIAYWVGYLEPFEHELQNDDVRKISGRIIVSKGVVQKGIALTNLISAFGLGSNN